MSIPLRDGRRLALNPLRPAFDPQRAISRPVRLPVGGVLDQGGPFARGTVLGCVGGAPTSEVWTISISGATGTVTFTFTAYKIYPVAFAHDAALAVVQSALEQIFGPGNVTVTGTPGTTYTVTFGNTLAQVLMGGRVTVVATSGTPTIARTTPGSAGAGQFAPYDNSSPGVARCILKYDYASDPVGGVHTEHGATGHPYSPEAYFAGFFSVADLVGFDGAALSDPGWRLVDASASSETGAVVGLGL